MCKLAYTFFPGSAITRHITLKASYRNSMNNNKSNRTESWRLSYHQLRINSQGAPASHVSHPFGWWTWSSWTSPSLFFFKCSRMALTPAISPIAAFPFSQSTTMGHFTAWGLSWTSCTIPLKVVGRSLNDGAEGWAEIRTWLGDTALDEK